MKLSVIKGDITRVNVEAIVNAANSSLLGGGGVDGAIHRAAGPELLNECIKIRNKQGGCKTGEAVITGAGNLMTNFVIHTVGPVWNRGQNDEHNRLKSCYENALKLAVENNIKTIAFPNISTGIYRFPKMEACKIAIETVTGFNNSRVLNEVVFVCFDDENYELYKTYLGEKTAR